MSFIVCGNKKLLRGERSYIMGIVNITPDSFSDGGEYYSRAAAVDYGLKLLDDGADIIDIGGVATSPLVTLIDTEEELRRVIPVVEALAKRGVSAISVDTSRALVAERALLAGASWINDQHAGTFDLGMPAVLARAQGVVLMHNRGLPGVHAGEQLIYDDVVLEVKNYFAGRLCLLAEAGVSLAKIILDPGIGFGKGLKDSLALINGIDALAPLCAMTLIGVSRKSFLGKLLGISDPKMRDYASLGATAAAIKAGANIIRTHNVKAAFDMLRVLDACSAEGGRSYREDIH